MTAFDRYVGIDYSGAQTPMASLKGLRVYLADGAAPAAEMLPPPSPRKYWTRCEEGNLILYPATNLLVYHDGK